MKQNVITTLKNKINKKKKPQLYKKPIAFLNYKEKKTAYIKYKENYEEYKKDLLNCKYSKEELKTFSNYCESELRYLEANIETLPLYSILLSSMSLILVVVGKFDLLDFLFFATKLMYLLMAILIFLLYLTVVKYLNHRKAKKVRIFYQALLDVLSSEQIDDSKKLILL